MSFVLRYDEPEGEIYLQLSKQEIGSSEEVRPGITLYFGSDGSLVALQVQCRNLQPSALPSTSADNEVALDSDTDDAHD